MNTPRRAHTLLLSCLLILTPACRSQQVRTDRQPAVAGLFYPSDPPELKGMLQKLFAQAVPPGNPSGVVAIIAPHAGYVFSGGVAASAFNQIDPAKKYRNIFILGPSHHVAFSGASVYCDGDFITPLGTVKVDRKLAESLAAKSDVFSCRADAQRDEHSVEVELPFLQYRMKSDFQIVPIVVGAESPDVCRKIADALRPFLTPENLFIISTDFSHYPSSNDAPAVDRRTADAIIANSADGLLSTLDGNAREGVPHLETSLCGWSCVLTLLYITQGNPDIALERLVYRNSGDSEAGDKERVVGYCAMSVSLRSHEKDGSFRLSPAEKKVLLAIARNAIGQKIRNGACTEVDTTGLSPTLISRGTAFVTLKKHGDLRGCVGRLEAAGPLYKTVQSMAVAAATQDYRFPPVEAQEIEGLEIEISVLTPMRKIASIDEIEPGKHGICLVKGGHSGTFLPQVATETGWSREELLGHCARDKAGIGWDGWKDADIYVYEACVFGEHDPDDR